MIASFMIAAYDDSQVGRFQLSIVILVKVAQFPVFGRNGHAFQIDIITNCLFKHYSENRPLYAQLLS